MDQPRAAFRADAVGQEMPRARGMLDRAFRHRSGRVVSLGRLVLAAILLAAIWLDPSQPRRYPHEGYAILFFYVLFAAAWLAITWTRWWTEFAYAFAVHRVDILLFGVMVFLTEGYTSPFFTFSVFLILSATIKWGRAQTARTALLVIMLYFLAGFAALAWSDAEVDVSRFLIRGGYLAVLSLLLIWFAMNEVGRGSGDPATGELAEPTGSRPPIRAALDHLARESGARRLVFAWADSEEPWVHVASLEHGRYSEARHPPGMFGPLAAPELQDAPFIFDRPRGCALSAAGRVPRLIVQNEPVDPVLAAAYAVGSGIAVPVASERHEGLMLAMDVPGLCSDDLATGERVRAVVSSALSRAAMIELTEEAAETRTRLKLARDLHDNVAQLLAGTALRLEGIRAAAARGRPVAEEIETLQANLAAEQRDLRGFIHRLRGGRDEVRADRVDLGRSLAALCARLSEQWAVECVLREAAPETLVAPALEHELHQLLREAVANAVRHGHARRVGVALAREPGAIRLTVGDDGGGFRSAEGESEPVGPKSLRERVSQLGGTLDLRTCPNGAEIVLTVPIGAEP